MNETDKLLNDNNKDNKDNKNIDIYVDIDLQSSTINSIDKDKKENKTEKNKSINQSLCNCCKILEPQEKIICGALISSIIITLLLIFL